ncbi:MAG: hypothetical protein JXL97_19355 [Bacteroidales bacterium]|nr:hypothetical protein [Bacteroidales bacterium]
MAKKNFKSGLDDFFKENINEVKSVNENFDKKEEKVEEISTETISIESISDEKLKWLMIKLQRFEKELHLWRTGKLTLEIFQETLENNNLEYDPDTREFLQTN